MVEKGTEHIAKVTHMLPAALKALYGDSLCARTCFAPKSSIELGKLDRIGQVDVEGVFYLFRGSKLAQSQRRRLGLFLVFTEETYS